MNPRKMVWSNFCEIFLRSECGVAGGSPLPARRVPQRNTSAGRPIAGVGVPTHTRNRHFAPVVSANDIRDAAQKEFTKFISGNLLLN